MALLELKTDEDSFFSYIVTEHMEGASDTDIISSAKTLPTWLTLNEATATLSGTPTNDDVGDHDVTLLIDTGTEVVSQPVQISVKNTNDAPVVTSLPSHKVHVGNFYNYQLTASDVDTHDVLTIKPQTLPTWLTFNPSTGSLSGTASNDDIGSHEVTFLIDDGTEEIQETFSLGVLGRNSTPDFQIKKNEVLDIEIRVDFYKHFYRQVDSKLSEPFLGEVKVSEHSTKSLTYTPSFNHTGFDTFTLSQTVTGSSFIATSVSAYSVYINDLPFEEWLLANNNLPSGDIFIVGNAALGETLSADTSALKDEDGLGTFSYEWKIGGVNQGDNSTFTLEESAVGKSITLTVKYQDKLGADESVVSGPTAQVLASFSQSTSADEIFQGMVGKDSFQFVKQLGNQHGTDVIRGFLKNEDQLWISWVMTNQRLLKS